MINTKYNLGEHLKLFMEKEYEDYEFSNAYDYIDLFENNTQAYINVIIDKINNLEDNINIILSNISSNPINLSLAEEFYINYSTCSNYSFIFTDYDYNNYEINNESLIELINITFFECLNRYNNELNSTNNDLENYTFFEKIEYIKNNSKDCYNDFNNISDIEIKMILNDSIHLLDCINHDFYSFSDYYLYKEYGNIVEDSINKIQNKIKNNFIDDKLLNNYLEKNIHLNSYNDIVLKDISFCFEGIENMINYANSIKYLDFKKFLYDNLIFSFNISYIYLFNNFITESSIIDADILMNSKIELYISYISKKMLDEYKYYLLILNNTDEIGFTSKNAFINLYGNIKSKLNESLVYFIKEEIYFYLNIYFIRKIKKFF